MRSAQPFACGAGLAVLAALVATAFPPASSSGDAPGRSDREGPIRVLFLGHESVHHNSNAYYPMLAQALGRDAIWFDYTTDVAEALEPAYLNRFDALMLYANHDAIAPEQMKALLAFVEGGGGFVPVHSASYCFRNAPEFVEMVGAQFKSHETGVFTARIVNPDHPAMRGVDAFEAWDETYVHHLHNEKNRTVLMVRDEPGGADPEPWTWVREQGKGRVFYTASGHDERTWANPGFHQLLKAGILWAVGDERRRGWEAFLAARPPLEYEKRDNIPNYENRPEPLPYQLPLSPEASMEHTQVPVGFRLELFASEPDIINPISLAWDERGRLWAAETTDYPNEVNDDRKGHDRIKILEDTDGDGRCDKVTVFADGLNIPTSLVFSRGGVVVSQAPEFLFLKDTDGDDRADVREVLMTGWGVNDTHAGPSNLRNGFDNWIWGTVGYAGFRGYVGGEDKRFGMGIFRVKPDGTDVEFLHQFNNNTWGLGFNEAGDAFGSTANNNPSFFGGIPETVFDPARRGRSAKMIADSRAFHPITPNIRQVDAFGNYTAGAGHALATSDGFPESYRDRMAFVCGPTGNLLGRFAIDREGSGFAAKNAFAMVASSDEWFSPVVAEVGPDGALWVADWYNFIIQHNPTPNPERGGYDARTGKGNAHVNPNRDREHGRIYRVVWEQAPEARIHTLAGADDADLVAALSDANLFWRQTAQRLLVDGGRKGAAPALREAVRAGGVGAIHALWTLEGLGELDKETHQLALLSGDAALRRNAIRALGPDEDAMQLFFDTAVVTDKDLLVRLAAFNKLAEFPDSDTVTLAAQQLMADPVNQEDEWLSEALRAAGARDVVREVAGFGPNLLPNPSFEDVADGRPAGWAPRDHGGTSEKSVDDRIARTGRRSVRIDSAAGADSSWFAPVAVEPDTDYRLSGWVRTEGVRGRAMGALMNVHELQNPRVVTENVRDTSDWRRIEVVFNSADRREVTINCLFGGWGRSTGSAWWDDVALEQVEYRTVEAVATNGELAGNPENGKLLFHEHPIAACIRCHAIEGAGGAVGPALDGIASRKSREYLHESLVDPGAAIAEGYTAEVSPMPPMGVLLKPQELADVMAYLMTLQ